MKRTAVLTGILLITGLSASSQIGKRQSFFELQFGAGPTFMITDVGNLGYGGNFEVNGKYRLHQHVAIKAGLAAALGLGSDAGTSNDSRGIKYYTAITELTGQLEFYILKEGRGYGKGGHVGYKPRARPYLFAGGGPTFFFPNHYQENAEPLGDYSNFTVILLGGVGFLYRVNADIFWGLQAGGRITTTDMLDGHSQGVSTGHDNYIHVQVLLTYRF